jgi:hypothetical protein
MQLDLGVTAVRLVESQQHRLWGALGPRRFAKVVVVRPLDRIEDDVGGALQPEGSLLQQSLALDIDPDDCAVAEVHGRVEGAGDVRDVGVHEVAGVRIEREAKVVPTLVLLLVRVRSRA